MASGLEVRKCPVAVDDADDGSTLKKAYARCDASADDARVRAEVFYHKLLRPGDTGGGRVVLA